MNLGDGEGGHGGQTVHPLSLPPLPALPPPPPPPPLTSSMMTTSKADSMGSLLIMRSRMPSVMNTILLPPVMVELKRILYATSLPCTLSVSWATRRQRDMALIRRGCVQTMRLKPPLTRN